MELRRYVSIAMVALLPACKEKPKPAPEPAEAAARPPTLSPRCAPISPDGFFVLGSETKPAGDGGEPAQDDLLPFAAEVGEAVARPTGFAVGAIHAKDGSPVMSVVEIGPDGRGAKVTALGPARADVEPPRLAANGAMLFAGVLEPEPGGRAIRLAKIDGGHVGWGARLHEKADESQAFDLALGSGKGIVVWDEDADERGAVRMSAFDPANPSVATPPRTISPERSDAESPRLVARPGGFWLGYVARRAEADDDDAEARFRAEAIGFRWVEVMALDANGAPAGPARAATPKDGHVMVFDMAPGPDGGALVVWRDDDAPSGATGGRVMRALVRPSSVEEPSVLVEDVAGAGVPNLVGSWLAIADAADSTRLGPISPAGLLVGPLVPEPEIGSGEPIAAASDTLLVARPMGRAVKLVVVLCRPDPAPDADAAP
jgi:hypothetical protein